MSPRDRKTALPSGKQPEREEAELEQPELAQPDWNGLADREIARANTDAPTQTERSERTKGLPDEEDDNFYQASDEALPEDEEEAALARNPSKEGGRFDEI